MKTNQKSDLPAWLLCRANTNQGLALIESLGILLLIAVLAALAWPIFWNPPGKAKRVEARNNIVAMNRAQQAYVEEKKGVFADSLEKLEIGIKSETAYYSYVTRKTDRAAFNSAISKEPALKSYAGAVWKVTGAGGKTATQAILCEAEKPAAKEPQDPVYKNGQFVCGDGTVDVSRYDF